MRLIAIMCNYCSANCFSTNYFALSRDVTKRTAITKRHLILKHAIMSCMNALGNYYTHNKFKTVA